MNDGWNGPPLGGAAANAEDLRDQVLKLVATGVPGKPGVNGAQPQKHDKDKTRLELIPPEFVEGIGKVLTFGAKKYAAGNWKDGDGFEWSRLYGALLRHMMAWANGEDNDPESGLSHLYHAGCMLAFLAAHVERGMGTDDRAAIGIRRQGK